MAYESILEWYSGKSRNVMITFVIPALVESAALGYWKKGVARQVRAALNKQNVAAKWSREVEKALEVDWAHPLRDGLMNMRYGSYGHAPRMFAPEALAKLHAIPYSFTKGGLVQDVGAVISRWARTNAEVAELVALLDARRPKPVVVMKTLSPTVAENVSRHIGIDVATIQSPPMHGEWIEHVHKGAKSLVFEIVIDWPEGTQHNKSRFLHSGNHSQCMRPCDQGSVQLGADPRVRPRAAGAAAPGCCGEDGSLRTLGRPRLRAAVVRVRGGRGRDLQGAGARHTSIGCATKELTDCSALT